jgi:hypothetical protein
MHVFCDGDDASFVEVPGVFDLLPGIEVIVRLIVDDRGFEA